MKNEQEINELISQIQKLNEERDNIVAQKNKVTREINDKADNVYSLIRKSFEDEKLELIGSLLKITYPNSTYDSDRNTVIVVLVKDINTEISQRLILKGNAYVNRENTQIVLNLQDERTIYYTDLIDFKGEGPSMKIEVISNEEASKIIEPNWHKFFNI